MSAYADTSFVVSLYVLDVNTKAAAAQLARLAPPILLTTLGELEFDNAVCLRLFRKEISLDEAHEAQQLFAHDIESGVFQIKPLAPSIVDAARLIARKHTPKLGTRTIDVLHVASALAVKADVFCTFDHRQRKLAISEGLKVPS